MIENCADVETVYFFVGEIFRPLIRRASAPIHEQSLSPEIISG
jgi:hypothetical protein